MPTVDDFVAAAEWVRERGWTIQGGTFADDKAKTMCPLTALACYRGGLIDVDVIKAWLESKARGGMGEMGKVLGFENDDEFTSFWRVYDDCNVVNAISPFRRSSLGGSLAVNVYNALRS